MTRNQLYLLIGALCTAGYSWFFFFYRGVAALTLCPFKWITGYPCPSCGTTRGIAALVSGHAWQAWQHNPLAFVVGFLMALLPIWLVRDVLLKSDSLFRAFNFIDQKFKNKFVFSIFALLIIALWIWNLNK